MLVSITALVVALAGTATAAGLITGADIKDNTVASRDVKNRTLELRDIGPKARHRLHGKPTRYRGPQWGIIDRNSFGSPVADLRGGPYDANGATPPPFGIGSLGIEVDRTATSTTNTAGAEKVSFGDEVDFQGDLVSGLSQIGFWVYSTSENDTGAANVSMPNISLEINPHVAGQTYTSMVYAPPQPTATSDWEHFDAATGSGPNNGWYFTNGSVGTATNCTQAHFCTLAEAKSALAANQTAPATILTVAISKGRDAPFIGAVDGLQVNGSVYDFEPFGVKKKPAA